MADKEKKNEKDVPKTVTGTINEKGGILGKMLTPRTSLAKYIAGKDKKEKETPTPVQGAGNMPLDDEEAAKQVEILKAQNEDKKVKKMNMGGMTQQERGRRGNPPERLRPRYEDPEPGPEMLQVDTPRMEDAIMAAQTPPTPNPIPRRGPRMARGGMTAPMMGASGAPESGPKRPMIMPPKPKPAPRPKGPAPSDDSDPRMKDPRERGGAMPMMKKGGKVRGYGIARGGKACKMR